MSTSQCHVEMVVVVNHLDDERDVGSIEVDLDDWGINTEQIKCVVSTHVRHQKRFDGNATQGCTPTVKSTGNVRNRPHADIDCN